MAKEYVLKDRYGKDHTYNDETIYVRGTDGELMEFTQGTSGGSSNDVRYVTFMSHDGLIEYGKKAVAVGDDCANPIARGVFDTPTRESDAQYSYTFYGWATTPNGAADSSALKAVEEDRTVYANFASAVRYYTITYYDSDGTTVLKTESLAYGTMPSYAPTKENFTFGGWTPAAVAVTGNASYTAVWEEKITFATASWAKIDEICASGKAAENFAIGDTKPVTLTYEDGTSETINFRIVDMDVDLMTDDTYAPLTLMADNLVKDSLQPASAYNKGQPWFYGMDNVNPRMELLYNALPADLQSVIKTVCKYKDTYRSFNLKVFIPSRKNLTGSEGTTNAAGYNIPLLPNKQYAYFTPGNTRMRRNKLSSTEDDSYWTSSARTESLSSYYTMTYEVVDGAVIASSGSNPANKMSGVCPCFCI